MKCLEVQDKFSSYYDNFLEGKDLDRFLEHLTACQDCRKDYEAFKTAVMALNSIQEIEAPDEIYLEVNRRIDRLKDSRGLFERILSNPTFTIVPQVASILIMFVLGGTIFYAYRTFMKTPTEIQADRPVARIDMGAVPSAAKSQTAAKSETVASVLPARMVEVVPCSTCTKRSRDLDRKIEDLVISSNGQILSAPPEGIEGHGEILIRVPGAAYSAFISNLKKAIDAENRAMLARKELNAGSLPDLPGFDQEGPGAEPASSVNEPAPIPEVKLIKVVF